MSDAHPASDDVDHLSGVLVIDDAATPKDLAHQLAYARCSDLDVRITLRAARRLDRRLTTNTADLRPGGRFLGLLVI